MGFRSLVILIFRICIIQYAIANNSSNDGHWEEINRLNYEAFHLQNINIDSGLRLNQLLFDRLIEPIDSLTLSNLLSVRGTLLQEKGEFNVALENYISCLRIREQLALNSPLAKIQLNIGNLYYDLGQIESALSYLRKSIKFRKKAKFKDEGFIQPFNTMALCYDFLNVEDSTRKYFQLAFKKVDTNEYSSTMIDLLSNIGKFHEDRNRLDSAYYFYSLIEKSQRKFDDKAGLAWTLNHLGRLFFERGDLEKANNSFSEAYDIADSVGSLEEQVDILRSQLLLSIEQGKIEEIQKYLHQYDLMNDSLIQSKINQNIQEVEAKYQNEKLSAEKALSEAKAATFQAENKSKQLWIYGLTAVLIALLLLTTFYVRNYRQKQTISQMQLQLKEQEMQELLNEQESATFAAMLEGQEEERQRIARDLHDRLGSTLATLRLSIRNGAEDQTDVELLDAAISEVRDIAYNLSSGVLNKHGFNVALLELKQLVERSGEVQFVLMLSDQISQLGQEVSLELYRIVQELCSNTLKHAQATEINLQTTFTDEFFYLIYEDNGVGFDPEQVLKGMGLQNIVKRAEKIGAKCHLDAKKGRGTIVIIDKHV